MNPTRTLRRHWRPAALLAVALVAALTAAVAAAGLAQQLDAADTLAIDGQTDQAATAYRDIVRAGLDDDNLSAADRAVVAMAMQELAILELQRVVDGDDVAASEQAQVALDTMQSGSMARVSNRYTQTVSHGEEVDLAALAVPGKITVFDFTSKYCGPCMAMRPMLQRLAVERRDDIAMVFVDINRPEVQGIDWQSPVAKQYEIRSIPHFRVYDAEGQPWKADSVEFGQNDQGQMVVTGQSNEARQWVSQQINAMLEAN